MEAYGMKLLAHSFPADVKSTFGTVQLLSQQSNGDFYTLCIPL